jgi:Protein of unknown function (DUF559)/AbiEi antitoxin C-terminal domain
MKEYERALIDCVSTRHQLITRDVARTVGISDSQWLRLVNSDTLIQLVPGVYHHYGSQLTWEARIRGTSRWLGREAAVAGLSAARWWGLDGFDDERVEFLVPRARRSVPNWVTVHTTKLWWRQDLATYREVRVTSPTRTIIDLAAMHAPARRIEAAIDSAMRRRLTSTAHLASRSAAIMARRTVGSSVLREVLLDSGGESCLERRFLRLVREWGLPKPSCQVIFKAGARTAARVDFLFEGSGLVVEVSGRLGHSSDADRRRDARRRNHLQSQGLRVLEFLTADVIDDPDYVLTTLTTELGVAA